MSRQELDNSEILSYEDFESLRCDRCHEYLICPIMVYLDQTTSKENIPFTECGRCFGKNKFPESSPSVVRNITAEALVAVTPFPCRYYHNGCKERRVWPKIKLHEQECIFRIFDWPALSDKDSCSVTGMDIIKMLNKEGSDFILQDGVVTLILNKSHKIEYVIQQKADIFLFKVNYDLSSDKAEFTVCLLEDVSDAECSIDFTSVNSKQCITLRIHPNSEKMLVDLKAIKALLGDNGTVFNCRVYLNKKLAAPSSSDLLKEIQCPACWDYMKGRIHMCSNGHSICSECTKSLQCCPVCRVAEIQTTRNIALEKVISQAFFPCRYQTEGCSYVSTLDEMICHQSWCRYNTDK